MSNIQVRHSNGHISPREFSAGFPLMRRFESIFKFGEHQFAPECDIEEIDKSYLVKMDAPGIKKEDISLELSGNVLTISGERKREKKEEKRGYSYEERSFGRFERSFTLPNEVDAKQIKASYDGGVLSIELPKTTLAEKKKIQISD